MECSIPAYVSKTPIEKGWSHDQKFCITAADGTKYLLRIIPKEKSDRIPDIVRLQQEAASRGIPMSKPVSCGDCEDGMFLVQTWIDGADAEAVIPHFSDAEQYAYGLEAGRILKQIHTIPAPNDIPDWESHFNAKIDRNISRYRSCPVQFDGADTIIAYLNANRHLLKNRPQCFQHGDYHIGNMMFADSKLVIIDFDRYDFGDPWEEFNRIVWCVQAAPPFASGMIDGYFDHCVPSDFWQLLALYICSNTLSSVPWAIPFGDGEVQTMLKNAADVLQWYDNMQNPVPMWYRIR